MFGFEQCCDAIVYQSIGSACLSEIRNCWHEYRPIGAIAINALLHGSLSSVFNHLTLLIFSAILLREESRFLSDKNTAKYPNIIFFKIIGLFAIFELFFIGLASVNLTDVPAGVLAATAILGFSRKKAVMFAVCGGLSVLIRASYLYPMIIFTIFFSLESLLSRNYKKTLILSIFFVILAPQFYLTYLKTNSFSFLDPASVKYWTKLHLSLSFYGYDTLLPASARNWQSNLPDLPTAYKMNQWGDIFLLLFGRLEFYFSSFVIFSKAYLESSTERFFSPLIGLFNFALLLISAIYLKERKWRVLLPLSVIVLQNLIIVPEQRFIISIQLLLFAFTYLYAVNYFSTNFLSMHTSNTFQDEPIGSI